MILISLLPLRDSKYFHTSLNRGTLRNVRIKEYFTGSDKIFCSRLLIMKFLFEKKNSEQTMRKRFESLQVGLLSLEKKTDLTNHTSSRENRRETGLLFLLEFPFIARRSLASPNLKVFTIPLLRGAGPGLTNYICFHSHAALPLLFILFNFPLEFY